LIWATWAGNYDIVNKLIEEKADVHIVNKFGSTAMHYCIYKCIHSPLLFLAPLLLLRLPPDGYVTDAICAAWCSCRGKNAIKLSNVSGRSKKQQLKIEGLEKLNEIEKMHYKEGLLEGGCSTNHVVSCHVLAVLLVTC
jgi:hypothetical protein